MKTNTFLFLTSTIIVFCAFTFVEAISWKVNDEKYAIKFDTKGASGVIQGLKGTILFDEANAAASSFDVTVDVNTINTGNGMKNKHAKGTDFLDAEHFPVISFTSEKIEKAKNGYTVTGNLKIKDVTKPVTIPFTFSATESEGTFSGKFEFNREDFNLQRKGVGEIVQMELVIPVKK